MSAAAIAAAAAVASAGAGIASAASSGKGGKTESPPKAQQVPVYDPAMITGLQSASNQQNALQQARLGQANVYGPLGSSIWQQNKDGVMDNIQTLNPERQAVIDSLWPKMAGVLDTSVLGGADLNASRKDTIDAILARANPQMERQRQSMETRLANAGITPGSQAWQNEMDAQGRNENDLTLQAELAGNTEQNTLFQQHLSQQQQAVANMQNLYGMTSTPYQQYNAPVIQPTDYIGAYSLAQQANMQNAGANNQNQNMTYNQRIAAQNARNSALAGIGSAGMGYATNYLNTQQGQSSLAKLFGSSSNGTGQYPGYSALVSGG